MTKKRFLLASVLIGIIIFLAGCNRDSTTAPIKTDEKHDENEETSQEITEEKAEYFKEQSESQTDALVQANEAILIDDPVYQDYSVTNYQALIAKKPMVLFFYAPWCSLCRAQDKDITANLISFPAKTKILRVDYDKEKELKEKYGISVQTSFVLLDSTGKVVDTLYDPSLDDLKTAIIKSL